MTQEAAVAARELFDRTVALPVELRESSLSAATADTKVLERTRRLLDAATALSATSHAGEARIPAAPPEQVGRYQIAGVLGQGGFGIVYSGRDSVLKRPVAIKVCLSDDPELRDRFVHEAEISARLQHPNVVTIYDFGVEDGLPYLVQELLSGEDMSETIRGRLGAGGDSQSRLRVLLGVAEGLAHAHRLGVVHRDVKPGNVRLTDSGNIKLLDFGIAQLLNQPADLSSEGSTAGTVGYLAPELLNGEPVGRRADVFSFGAMAFEWLSGRRAFPGTSFAEVAYALLFTPVDLDLLRVLDVPEDVVRWVGRCLEKDPADRYADASDVAESLREMLAADGPTEREEEIGRQPGKDSRPGWSGQGAKWAGAVVGLGLISLSVPLMRPLLSTGPPGDTAVASKAPAEDRGLPTSGPELQDVSEEGAESARSSADKAIPAPSPTTLATRVEAAAAQTGPPSGEDEGRRVEEIGVGESDQPLAETTETSRAPEDFEDADDRSAEDELPDPTRAAVPGATSESAEVPTELSTEVSSDRPNVEVASSELEPAESRVIAEAPKEPTVDPIATEPLPESNPKTAGPHERDPVTGGELGSDAGPRIYVDGQAGVEPPQALDRPAAEYPRRARRRQLSAQVVVAVFVDAEGRVTQTALEVPAAGDLGFNEAAERAARATRFKPAVKDGVPGAMWTRLIYDFQP